MTETEKAIRADAWDEGRLCAARRAGFIAAAVLDAPNPYRAQTPIPECSDLNEGETK